MANDFKNAHKQGITTITDIYEAPAGKTSILLELDVANVQTSIVSVTVTVTDASNSDVATNLVKLAPLPTGGTLQVVSGQKVILEAGDKVQVATTGTCDVVAAVLEDV
jgi:hypothetical protein|tara:strand:+ start:261 stop:584 length:324 start_codon:yes stop_codon:yes gene_type:complete